MIKLAIFIILTVFFVSKSKSLKIHMSSNPFSSFFSSSSSKPPVIAVTGSTGLVGTALCSLLEDKYDAKIIKLVRNKARANNDDCIYWDPSSGVIEDSNALSGVDAVVHLAGENVASGDGPLAFLGIWSDSKKQKIMNSRVDGTKLIVDTIKSLPKKPKVLISASGIGYYGYTDPTSLFDESSGQGEGFLAEVVDQWETEALRSPTRTVCLRLAPVFSGKAGILAKLIPLFNLFAGGVIGSGNQAFSWVTLNDTVRAIEYILFNSKGSSLKGPINVCSPNPATNADFTSAMGAALGRPTIFPLPEFVAGNVFGQMGQEMLLGGQKAVPKKLVGAGFTFEDTDLTGAIKSSK